MENGGRLVFSGRRYRRMGAPMNSRSIGPIYRVNRWRRRWFLWHGAVVKARCASRTATNTVTKCARGGRRRCNSRGGAYTTLHTRSGAGDRPVRVRFSPCRRGPCTRQRRFAYGCERRRRIIIIIIIIIKQRRNDTLVCVFYIHT